MKTLENEIRIKLDVKTIRRLRSLAAICRAHPSLIAASIVRDVLEDDARMHDSEQLAASISA